MIVKGKGAQDLARHTFQSLRHRFSSALANAGVSEAIRMKLTGHRSADIHRKYAHMSNVPLEQAIDSLGPTVHRQQAP